MDQFDQWCKEQYRLETGFEKPESLSEVAGSAGRIAVIYADGNNMGELLQSARNVEDFGALSEALRRAIRDAVFQALFEVFLRNTSPKKKKKYAPFEIIALGGDDALLVVPASDGWDVSRILIERFQNHGEITGLRKRLGDSSAKPVPLTISVGVAIADMKYPISFLVNLAQGLLKEAKRWARQTQAGTLCHLWLRAPIISESASMVLKPLYYKRAKSYSYRLTARPYTCEEAERLTDLARALKQLAKSQRRALAESLAKGVHVSLNYALYQAARVKGGDLQEIFEKARELVFQRGSATESPTSFWVELNGQRTGDIVYQTALLDALELADLLPPYKSEAQTDQPRSLADGT
ncbi:hypothetical protein HRbin36_01331 [bacterium HR36]|nr:hypothetical protein HRbin36_01331 [bacterium HR36]